MVIMMSMAGVPFLAGFYAKWMVLQAIVNIGLVWLAILGVVFSVIGAFYYLRVVKCVYFDKPEQSEPIEMSLDTEIVISANGLLLVVIGLYPTALMTWCATALLN
jgi:NADH-quinone oxidoreductase subunit N